MVQPISGVHEFQQNEGKPDEMLGVQLLHSKIIMHIPILFFVQFQGADKENLPKTQELL